MLPSELQGLMAKILFFLFSITIICLGKVKACEVENLHFNTPAIEKNLSSDF